MWGWAVKNVQLLIVSHAYGYELLGCLGSPYLLDQVLRGTSVCPYANKVTGRPYGNPRYHPGGGMDQRGLGRERLGCRHLTEIVEKEQTFALATSAQRLIRNVI